jgi:hypothetical protein
MKYTLVFIDQKGWFLEAEDGTLVPTRSPFVGGGGGGSSASSRGIMVQVNGTQINGRISTLNLIGDLVTGASPSTGQANVTVKIPSLTTAQRIALVPTTAMIVEDTDLDMYFKWSTVSSSWTPF